mgnify:CR=1 FL=1
MEIDKKLERDITEYCKVNGLNKKEFVNQLLRKAFTVEKYGEKPFYVTGNKEKVVNDNKTEKKKIEEIKPIIVKEENEPKLEIIKDKINRDNKKNCMFKTEEMENEENRKNNPSIKKNKRVLV